MQNPGLRIEIPKPCFEGLEAKIRFLKVSLAYLETPGCRKHMEEAKRRATIKAITEKFRAALRMRSLSPQIESWPGHSQIASSSDPNKTPSPPSRPDFQVVVVPPESDEANSYD